MTIDILLTLGILLFAIVLFVTEILRADLVALLVLVLLVLVGLVTPEESISGFSNPAVITTWAVFILSAGLSRTGVAGKLAGQVLRLAGKGESRLLAVLMSSTAAVSAFVINVGVAAMFLPVTLDLARKTKLSPSRLLLPMVYGTTVGGMLVLIGTASNLVVVDFLREAGLRTPGLFSFTPVGAVILLFTIVYMLLIGRRLLPERQSPSVERVEPDSDFRDHYEIEERLAEITIPPDSTLAGKTLEESRFGQALGLNVLSVRRGDNVHLIPEPNLELKGEDRLIVLGRLDMIDELAGSPLIMVDDQVPESSCLTTESIGLVQLEVTEKSIFNGKTLVDLKARQRFGVNLLAVKRGEQVYHHNLANIVFQPGDRLLFRSLREQYTQMPEEGQKLSFEPCEAEEFQLDDHLLYVRIPESSSLAGSTLKNVRLSDAYDIIVLNIIRDDKEILMPGPDTELRSGDLLVIEGRPFDIEVLRGHQTLLVDRNPAINLAELETDSLTVVEIMLSPHSNLTGKTLRQLNFREKFGVSVLAIWRGDRAYRTRLNDMPLQFGDALLCYGSRDRFALLSRERDFVILNLDYQEKPLEKKAPLAGLIMAAVLATVMLNWLPIYIAAIAGVILMVISRCLTIEEAYRAIEWKAVFLIAAMLPLGLAMQKTGAAMLIADHVIDLAGPYGPTAVLAGLMIMTIILNQFIPSAVNAVVMAPIAIAAAVNMGVSPYPLVMAIAYAVAASFMTPVSHPVNILIMSPGGYRFSDYLKNGLPISLIVLIVSILLLPVVFPY
jgi:di/tricarboxylate transporter